MWVTNALSDLEGGGQQAYSLSSRRLPFHCFDIGDHSEAGEDQVPLRNESKGRVKKTSLRERANRGREEQPRVTFAWVPFFSKNS